MNSSEITQRIADGRPMFVSSKVGLSEDRVMKSKSFRSLGEMLKSAYKETGLVMPESPKQVRTWGQSDDHRVIYWSHPIFGSLSLEIEHRYDVGEVIDEGPTAQARIYVMDQPASISFRIRTVTAGVRVLHAQGERVTDVSDGNVPTFSVPITWHQESGTPHTRVTDQDNIDLIFMAGNGMFSQIQVSMVTRARRFWLQIQELWCGQVVRTNIAKAKSLDVSYFQVGSHAGLVVPLYGENAYRGVDYIKSNKMASTVITDAINRDMCVPMGEAIVAEWREDTTPLPATLVGKGWTKATVLWYNLVIGYGFVRLSDGRSSRVHFSKIVDENGESRAVNGDCPVLRAMTGVAVKYKPDDKGRLDATAILVL
ncbi:MAG: hypothetical protein KGI79_02185 [Patescibacteria group bacterium]|nr:hypothetical protein [Patescibacteria group bacterium]MDE2116660.1 hypothetical protein [Patescibacteria group bacterium]